MWRRFVFNQAVKYDLGLKTQRKQAVVLILLDLRLKTYLQVIKLVA